MTKIKIRNKLSLRLTYLYIGALKRLLRNSRETIRLHAKAKAYFFLHTSDESDFRLMSGCLMKREN